MTTPGPAPESYPDRETYRMLYRRYVDDRSRPSGELLDLAGDLAGKAVLDLCGGSGALSLDATRRGAASVTMVDLASQMADLEALSKEGVRAKFAEVAGWLSQAEARSFDAAFCRQAVNYWLTPEAASALAGVLRPGAPFVFNTFSRQPPRNPADGIKSYLLDGRGFVELSWLCPDGTVQHVQCREGVAPHATRFRWIPEEEYRSMLEPHFSLEIRKDGGTDLYVCRRSG